MISYVFVDMDNTIAENITCKDIEFCVPIEIKINYLFLKLQQLLLSFLEGPTFIQFKQHLLQLQSQYLQS